MQVRVTNTAKPQGTAEIVYVIRAWGRSRLHAGSESRLVASPLTTDTVCCIPEHNKRSAVVSASVSTCRATGTHGPLCRERNRSVEGQGCLGWMGEGVSWGVLLCRPQLTLLLLPLVSLSDFVSERTAPEADPALDLIYQSRVRARRFLRFGRFLWKTTHSAFPLAKSIGRPALPVQSCKSCPTSMQTTSDQNQYNAPKNMGGIFDSVTLKPTFTR